MATSSIAWWTMSKTFTQRVRVASPAGTFDFTLTMEAAFEPHTVTRGAKQVITIEAQNAIVRIMEAMTAEPLYECIEHGAVKAADVYEAEGGGYGHASCWKTVTKTEPRKR